MRIYFYIQATISCTLLPNNTTQSSRHLPKQRGVTARSLTHTKYIIHTNKMHTQCTHTHTHTHNTHKQKTHTHTHNAHTHTHTLTHHTHTHAHTHTHTHTLNA